MMVLLLVLGAASLLGQVALLREVTVTFFGSELITILGLGLWLAGSGGGALAGRRGFRPTVRHLQAAFLAFGAAVPAAVILARGTRLLWGGVPGAYLPFPVQLAAMAAVLVPAAVLSGLLFQWTVKRAAAEGRTLAAAYAAECGGALLGGAGSTLLLACGAANLLGAMLCGTAAAGTALLLTRRGGSRGWSAGAAVILALLVWGSLATGSFDRRLTAWNHPHLLDTRDTPYGRITVAGTGGQVAVFVNDALAFENQGTAAEEFVHPAVLQCADPRRILVLGGGLTGILGEVRKHRPQHLVYVDMNPAVLALLHTLPLGRQTDAAGTAGDGPSATDIVKADPRRYLQDAREFDLILVGMPEPSSGADNRYYTREFFAACSRSLAPGGVLAFRLQGSENLWTPALARRNSGIRRALGAVFPSVAVLPGAVNVFIASGAPLPGSDTVAARWLDRGLRTDLVTPAYLRYLYTNDRFAEVERRLAETTAPVNTDTRPSCYRETQVLWLSRFFPRLGWAAQRPAGAEDLARSPWFWGAAVAWPILAFASRGRESLRRFLVMAAAAAAGMVLQSVLILAYQARSGAMYQDLGLLLSLFMLGMTLGAAGAAADAARGRDRIRGSLPHLLLCGSGLAVALLAGGGQLGRLPLAAGMLIAVAAAVGSVFAQLTLPTGPQAVRLPSSLISPSELAPVLLGADLIGGSAGFVGAGLFLIPVWGLAGSALAAAALGLGALAASRPARSF